MHCSKLVLTINYDLCLLGLCCVNAGDVAAVRASVSDIDPVDGQDANSLCGMRQSFTMGLSLHPVRLVRRNSLKFRFLIIDVLQRASNMLPLRTSLPG